ncbi:MAG: DUF5777 family beta-barrel protein [Bacteroidales bacterium]|nr:DUF5777 family beta-barrel protein [Bacteroidales bacterium]
MKKVLFTMMLATAFALSSFSQEDESTTAKEKDKPVRPPFQSGYLIDNQTTFIPSEGTLEYVIQHKFGTMDNGFSDLFGLYAPGANIRLALNYVLIKNLQVGYGITRQKMHSDFNVKYTILEQTRQNTIPVAVAFYGNIAIDGSKKDIFGEDYNASNRLSYFSQLIIGRKFNDWLSLQFNTSFTHYNSVDSDYEHDVISLGINGRAQFSPQSSIIFQYDSPLKIKAISEQRGFYHPAKPNLGIGWEICTSTHAFHIYVASADGLIPQQNMMFNQNDFSDGGLMLGFTITRLWSF